MEIIHTKAMSYVSILCIVMTIVHIKFYILLFGIKLFWKHFLYIAFEMLLWKSFSMEIFILGGIPIFSHFSPHCPLVPSTIPNECSYFSFPTAPQTWETLYISLCIFCLYFSCSSWTISTLWGQLNHVKHVSRPISLLSLSLTLVVALSCPSWIILHPWSLRALKLNAFLFPILILHWFFLLVNRLIPAGMLITIPDSSLPHLHVKLHMFLAPSIGLVPKLVIKLSVFLHDLQSLLYLFTPQFIPRPLTCWIHYKPEPHLWLLAK